ncbi:baseplate J/gp47 family protein [Oryzomonas rubra]|uniref:Uncharacterized protein n=1 Tax=Oryzomonas rubra TaxID=2509454 RepID=A0A5A9X997_9BACT|nr:baseplate J/gp47 family protein [Oryzomonas rubra]KAA0888779.1 hypothetical protein ET418_15475 [Oryzomonas rubra]
MAFEIVTAETRYSRMKTWFTGICSAITDFTEGSKIRSKFETVAVEMESRDLSFYQAIKKAIPISLYRAFSFTLKSAQKSTGYVVFSVGTAVTKDTLIAKGTIVSTDPSSAENAVTFVTTDDAYITNGNTSVTAHIECSVAGTAGNVSAGQITKIASSSSATACTNTSATTGGTEKETEEERRIRFLNYISSLSRATPAALVYGATTAALYDASGITTDSVSDAVVEELFITNTTQPAGLLNLYIYNGTGGTSAALVAATQKIIDGYTNTDGTIVAGYKAAGVVVTVMAATETAINFSVAITLQTGYDSATVISTVKSTIDTYVNSLGVGKAFIYNEMVERIMGISGVYNAVISAPTADMTPAANQVYLPGTKTVTAS